MTVQTEKGSMRSGIYGIYGGLTVNIADVIIFDAEAATWTQGSILIDAISLVPPFTQQWSLLQVSVSAQMQFIGEGQPFGKFSKILAGLTDDAQTPRATATGTPYRQPMTPLPQDMSGIQTLWDPAVDPLPPNFRSGISMPVSCNISLPTPIPIDQAVPIGIGIWMPPSLLGDPLNEGWGLIVHDAEYCITYDDNLTPTGI